MTTGANETLTHVVVIVGGVPVTILLGISTVRLVLGIAGVNVVKVLSPYSKMILPASISVNVSVSTVPPNECPYAAVTITFSYPSYAVSGVGVYGGVLGSLPHSVKLPLTIKNPRYLTFR